MRVLFGFFQLGAGPLAIDLQQEHRPAGYKTAALGCPSQPVRIRWPAQRMDKRAVVSQETTGRPIARAGDRKTIARVQYVIPIREADTAINAELKKFGRVQVAESNVSVNLLLVTAMS